MTEPRPRGRVETAIRQRPNLLRSTDAAAAALLEHLRHDNGDGLHVPGSHHDGLRWDGLFPICPLPGHPGRYLVAIAAQWVALDHLAHHSWCDHPHCAQLRERRTAELADIPADGMLFAHMAITSPPGVQTMPYLVHIDDLPDHLVVLDGGEMVREWGSLSTGTLPAQPMFTDTERTNR